MIVNILNKVWHSMDLQLGAVTPYVAQVRTQVKDKYDHDPKKALVEE